MKDTYRTVARISEGSITEQRSRFIAFAVPVQSPEEAKATVEKYRKRYYDARHVCWAYMLGVDRDSFRANDDGEPSSTAGKPILGAINSLELTDMLVVVVRYFGGVKLGTGGLVAAYRTAAQEALASAEIIEKMVEETLEITFEYPAMNAVMRIVREENAIVATQAVDTDCRMMLRIRRRDAERLKQKLLKVDTLCQTL
jgi:uncharacterized YigZ family protein